MRKTDKYTAEFTGELLGRMCIDGEQDAPEELFDLVSSLDGDGDGDGVPAAAALSVGDLREDRVREVDGRECLTGKTENGFAVTCYRLTSDTNAKG